MTLERFFRLVQVLSNSIWVRHYLSSFPGKLVLEVANLKQESLEELRAELTEFGFEELPTTTCGAISLHRFAVSRTDAPV
jgi:hypothetical protein